MAEKFVDSIASFGKQLHEAAVSRAHLLAEKPPGFVPHPRDFWLMTFRTFAPCPPVIICVPNVCAPALSGGWKNGKAFCSLILPGNRDVLLTPKKNG